MCRVSEDFAPEPETRELGRTLLRRIGPQLLLSGCAGQPYSVAVRRGCFVTLTIHHGTQHIYIAVVLVILRPYNVGWIISPFVLISPRAVLQNKRVELNYLNLQ
jgi:hypothetical protein